MGEKVLITGITGFLGSHLAKTLVEEGYEIIGLKRNSSSLVRIRNIIGKIELLDVEDLDLKLFFANRTNISTIIFIWLILQKVYKKNM